MTTRLLLLVALVSSAGCAARTAPAATAPAPAAAAAASHENLNAVLWLQTSVEYEAAALQAYRLATIQLDAALADPSWTAALEQTGDPAALPPAVILDVDETVLDNSYYQARLIRDEGAYDAQTWDPWVQEERATAVPGAREFTQYAASRGVTVFYVTNRTANLEEATRRNLAALRFPVSDAVDTVLVRGERTAWQSSAKGPRRADVASRYRVLMLVGDDLGDFVADASGTPGERHTKTAPHADWWGRRWIVIPNPLYGSWERAILGNAGDPSGARRRGLKFDPK